jgi:hypothetical protein
MVVKDLKSSMKKEKIVTFEKKDDADLYDLVRGGKSAMMVQRKDENEDYIPRRKVIMMISSESDEEYTPRKSLRKVKIKKDRTQKNQMNQLKKGQLKIVISEEAVHLPLSRNNRKLEKTLSTRVPLRSRRRLQIRILRLNPPLTALHQINPWENPLNQRGLKGQRSSHKRKLRKGQEGTNKQQRMSTNESRLV